ncbi:hypothetical protein Tco_0523352 [Tanacetum coccineum]
MAGYRCALCRDYLVQLISIVEETEIPEPLPIAPLPVLPSDDPYLIVRQAHTPATIDTKSEPNKAPSKMEEFQPLAARTTPPSSDHTPISSDSTPVSPLTNESLRLLSHRILGSPHHTLHLH